MAKVPLWKQPDVVLIDVIVGLFRALVWVLTIPLSILQMTLVTWLWVRHKLTGCPPPLQTPEQLRADQRTPTPVTRWIWRPVMGLIFGLLVVPITIVQLIWFTMAWLIARL